MSGMHQEVTEARARLNRWRLAWAARMGWPGLAALALLLLALALGAVARPYLQDERDLALKRYVDRLDTSVRLAAVAASAAAAKDPRDLARENLPSVAERGHAVAKLLKLLGQPGAGVQGAEYQTEEWAPELLRLRVSLPFSGKYAALRSLVANILDELPFAALDGLDLEAPDGTQVLEGKLQFSLFFRRERP